MQSKWKRILTYGGKTVIAGVVLAVFLSPLGNLIQLPEATAAVFCAKVIGGKGGGSFSEQEPVPANGQCPAGKSRVNTEDVTQRVPGDGEDAENCNTITSCIASVVYVFTVGIASLVAYAAAWMFSLSVALSLQSTAYALTFLSTAWTSVRDIANMFFILILVYIALTIMLRADTADTMKKLAWVIVIALLINFSFFFTRVVIDTGNLLAIQFYNAIDAEKPSYIGAINPDEAAALGNVSNAEPYSGPKTKDLTASIMNAVGVHTILNNASFKAFQDENNTGFLGSWQELILLVFVYVAAGIMFAMLAAAFFAIGIKFLIRIVVLWVVLFTSPLAFVANTLEKGKKVYQIWQTALISYSLYPAVFLFMFYVLTLLMKGLRGENGRDTILGQAFGDINSTTQVGFSYIAAASSILIIYLAIVLIFLYLALKAADHIHKMASGSPFLGSGPADGFARWATRWGSNIGFGGAAFLARGVIGGPLSAQANTKFSSARNLAATGLLNMRSDSMMRRGLGRLQRVPLDLARLGAQASFDPRNVSVIGKAAKTVLLDNDYGLGKVNYDAGTPSSGGKVQQASDALKRRVNTQASAPPFPTDGAKVPATLGGPHTPPPLTAHATPDAGKELVALNKIQKAVKELGGDLKHSASATEKLAETAAKPKITHSSSMPAELGARLEGVETALLARSKAANDNKPQLSYSQEKPMPVIDMTKNKEGVFEMVPEPPHTPPKK